MRPIKIAKLLILLSCVLFLFSLPACETTGAGIFVGGGPHPVVGPPAKKGGPPPHAPAHGYRAKYKYHYYPDSHVYYDTSRGVYFYLEGDSWGVSASLPSALHVSLGGHVTIEMDSDLPYTEFKQHKQKYPPGKVKKKRKGRKW